MSNNLTFPRFEEIPFQQDSTQLLSAVRDLRWPVMLDSGTHDGGMVDIIAAAPAVTLVTRGNETTVEECGRTTIETADPFDLVRSKMGEVSENFSSLPFEGGAIGYFGYDLARRIEHLPQLATDIDQLPEMMVGIYDWAIVVDHQNCKSWLIGQGRFKQTAELWPQLRQRLNRIDAHPSEEPLQAVTPFISAVSRHAYQQAFDVIQEYISAGDCYQVNYAQRFSASVTGDGWLGYQHMRRHNPAPFGAYMQLDGIEVLSFSPERFLQLRCGAILTQPIKGTRPRGASPGSDLKLRDQLYNSSKDRAENLMIVDLLRNDLGRVAEPGSIEVPELFKLESYATVHHLVSHITGKLRHDEDALSLLRACFPGGSITGAPKIRAMQIIEELEPCRRGIYCGAIAHIGFNGDMDSSIVIRTLVRQGDRAHYRVGGGIVADSDADEEYQECMDKAAAFRRYFG
ncbi:MAG: aminodeoxychorismate synthase component I [Pseudomonadota bacterium]|nr:aminodeoxychorismate synthase component I [Pseudomonadota bacterium]